MRESSNHYHSTIEMTSCRAITLLEDCGFKIANDWVKLTQRLGVPIEVRNQAKIKTHDDCQEALEECIDWYITNNASASWEEIIEAVGKTNQNAARKLSRLVIGEVWRYFEVFTAIVVFITILCLVLESTSQIVGLIVASMVLVVALYRLQQFNGKPSRSFPSYHMHVSDLKLTFNEVENCDEDYHEDLSKFCKKSFRIYPVNHSFLHLPFSVKRCNQDFDKSSCYVSFCVFSKSDEEDSYNQLTERNGYRIQESCRSNTFCLYLQKPSIECKVDIHLVSLLTEDREVFKFNRRQGTITFNFRSISTVHNNVSALSLMKLAPNEKYHRFTENLRKFVLRGSTDAYIQEWAYGSTSALDDDQKALLHIHLGFLYQMTGRFSPGECYDKSKNQLETAIDICEKGDCRNEEFLLGRACTFKAQNFFFAGEFQLADDFTERARYYFSFIHDRYEKSGVVYQQAMLATKDELEGKKLSDDAITNVAHLMDYAIELASMGSSSDQAQRLRCFMLTKKAMLYLHVFNFAHRNFPGRPDTVSADHLAKAEKCLSLVNQEIVKTNSTTLYNGAYYLALSECRRHQQDYQESLKYLQQSENQFRSCESQFPQDRITKWKTALSEQIK